MRSNSVATNYHLVKHGQSWSWNFATPSWAGRGGCYRKKSNSGTGGASAGAPEQVTGPAASGHEAQHLLVARDIRSL